MTRSDLIALSESLERLLDSMDAPPADLLSTVFGDWAQIVGAEVARHCRPVSLDGDRLVVEAADPVWASELKWLSDQLLRRLAETPSGDRLKAITVRVAPPA
ncbi:MAG: DUF721 domain-containing protein [Acidimicrobiaceae bacterium]|nr:DUF721 domain-containing protein [Acidimicrobiaceae bacterium]